MARRPAVFPAVVLLVLAAASAAAGPRLTGVWTGVDASPRLTGPAPDGEPDRTHRGHHSSYE